MVIVGLCKHLIWEELDIFLDPKSMECIFLRYCAMNKAYRLYDPRTKELIKSRDVVFSEIDDNVEQEIPVLVEEERPATTIEIEEEESKGEMPLPRRFGRIRRPPIRFDELGLLAEDKEEDAFEPNTYEEAMDNKEATKWSMIEEINAINSNHTWTLTSLPSDRKAIGSRWGYKIKNDAKGNSSRYNARIVGKGYSKIEGIDYFDTFSMVAKITSNCFLQIQNYRIMYIQELTKLT